MSQLVGAAEAARRLGIQKATLYAYVSRGLLTRRMAADGRTSLYAAADLDALAVRSRRSALEPRPSIDVQIVTAVSSIDEDGVRYRGHDVAGLTPAYSFEQVAELLWTGDLPALPNERGAAWPSPAVADERLVRRVNAVVGAAPLPAMAALAIALGPRHPDDDGPAAARRLIGLLPTLLGGDGGDGGIARRLAACWSPTAVDALAPTLDRALVLLADHELATSTLAVRVAASTRTGPYPAFAAGLTVLGGPLHGGASAQVHQLLVECEETGASTAIGGRLAARERLPGFGHRIYRRVDPRLRPLMDAVAELPDPTGRRDVVQDLLVEAGVRITRPPNVDLGLGALSYVAGLPAGVPLFAVARIAGFAAHLMEELDEAPLRYRGLARQAG